jgi:stress response protein YsnF
VYDRRPNEEFRPFKEGTVEVTEKSEVPVVTKEPRIVEEVSVNKQVRDRDETVQDSVRRTEVEVEKLKDEPRDL